MLGSAVARRQELISAILSNSEFQVALVRDVREGGERPARLARLAGVSSGVTTQYELAIESDASILEAIVHDFQDESS